MIPVVRRSVTVNVTNVFDFPYGCASCGIVTTAHVTAAGEGRAQSAYVAPNEHSARERAYANAHGKAYGLLASCPCPRCGAHSENQRRANAEWARTAPAKTKLANRIGLAGLILVAIASVGACANGASSGGDPMKEAFVGGVAALIIGLIVVGVLYGALSPKAEPKLLSDLPEGLWFDPPEAWRTLTEKAAIAARPRPAVQLVGEPCVACSKTIVFEHQAVACETCAAPVHDTCHVEHTREQHAPAAETPYRA
jgi:hypothetical protein